VVSYAQALVTPGQQWATIVTIEGLGDGNGIWKFCSRRPDYAVSADYKPWLVTYPDLLEERVSPLGGMPESGELSVQILDVGRALTGALRFLGSADMYWTADVTASATTGTVSGTPIVGDVLWSGNEAIRVDAVIGATITSMTRGFLDTDPWAHRSRDSIFPGSHYITGRRMRLFLVPVNGDSSADETEIGQYRIDDLELDETLNGITLRGTTQFQYLARMLPRQPKNFVVRLVHESPAALTYQSDGSAADFVPSTDTQLRDAIVVRIGDELLKIHGWLSNTMFIDDRAVLGSQQGEIEVGANGSVVLTADPDVQGCFRYFIGATPYSSTHPMDILLAFLTSSYHPDDGMYGTNTWGSYNWSYLPIGWGLGIPTSQIDVQSFLDVKARYADLDFKDFYFGDEQVSFAEFVTETFLRPLGAYLSTASGQLAIVVPKLPTEADSSVAITTADILTDQVPDGPGAMVAPGVRLSLETKLIVSSVAYVARDANGQERAFRVENSDFAETFGQRGYFGTESGTIKINLRSFRAPRVGVPSIIQELAYKRLFRFQRPLLRLTFRTSLRFMGSRPGQLFSVTMPELPDFANGSRGWVGVTCEIIGKRPVIGADGAFIEWTVLSYGPNLHAAWIAPIARVASVAGAGPYTATCTANRFTDPAGPLGLPATDVGAFETGDVVELRSVDGSVLAAGTRYTITVTGANTISLPGNFGGALAAGTFLCYTGYDNAVSQQRNRFAFQSDSTLLTPGASSDQAYVFGEP
jgi:hypothetical protein